VQIKGGVCYFLWDEKFDGPCTTTTIQAGIKSQSIERYLGEHGDVFVRFNESLPILQKVLKKSFTPLDEKISSSKPFGFRTNFTDYSLTKKTGMIELYGNGGVYFIPRKKVEVNNDWIDSWKVLLPALGPGNDGYPHKILGQPIVAAPGSCCTETYIVAGLFSSQKEAENFASYCRTRFFRFLVALRKNTQHATKRYFKFVPELDMKKKWSDELLYKEFGITEGEVAFINSIVREMED
jgi:site-specific DNA-methyltransferase (adenine-specific)